MEKMFCKTVSLCKIQCRYEISLFISKAAP